MTYSLEFVQEQVAKDVESLPLENVVNWLADQTWSDFAMSLFAQYHGKGFLSEKQEASARSMMAKCMARKLYNAQSKESKPEVVTAKEPEPVIAVPTGMHMHADGTVIKVYNTQAGHLVGKILVEDIGFDGPSYEFVYGGKSAIKGLSTETLLPVEEARKFGRLTSMCVNCLKQLNDERSIAAGYGATCARNHGWWYPTMKEAMAIIAAENLEVAA